jgi:hypothetical protein
MTPLPTVTLLGIDCVDIDRLILAAELCCKDFTFAKVKLLTSLPSDHPNIVKIDPITSVEAYSKFMVSKLDAYVDTPHVLIFQHDGFILNPGAWTDEFLKWDYIGAPWLGAQWLVDRFAFPKELTGTHVVGNGGFSMRSKKFVETCARLNRAGAFTKYQPEDIMLTVWERPLLEKEGIRIAPYEVAKQFSYEDESCDEYPGPYTWQGQFGFHGLRYTDISNWLKDHPEYRVDRKKGEMRKEVKGICPICKNQYSEQDKKVTYHVMYVPEITSDSCRGCNYAEYLIRHPEEVSAYPMEHRKEIVKAWTIKNRPLIL